jgi:hypothetical protein
LAPDWGDSLKFSQALLPGFTKTLKTAEVDSEKFAKAASVASLDGLFVSEYSEAKNGRDDFLASVKRLGYDGSSAWAKPAKKTAAKPAKKASGKPAKKAPAKKTGKLSPEARKRIAGAVKKRWANSKAAGMKPISEDDDPEGGDT